LRTTQHFDALDVHKAYVHAGLDELGAERHLVQIDTHEGQAPENRNAAHLDTLLTRGEFRDRHAGHGKLQVLDRGGSSSANFIRRNGADGYGHVENALLALLGGDYDFLELGWLRLG
jgi:hypothetical protein